MQVYDADGPNEAGERRPARGTQVGASIDDDDPPHLSIPQRIAFVLAAAGAAAMLIALVLAEDQHNRVERETARAAVAKPP